MSTGIVNGPLTEQSDAFNQHHEALKVALQRMHKDACRVVNRDVDAAKADDEADSESEDSASGKRSKSAQTKQKKVLTSLLNHWAGLTVFVDNPQFQWTTIRASSQSVIL
ncbi:MAG: hypothetical protein ABFS02_09650 [Pseudomonadota bacterium]